MKASLRYIVYVFVVGVMLTILKACKSTNNHLTVSKLFNNNMVIQRNRPIKIWGESDNGAWVKVKFNKVIYKVASKKGKWLIELPEMQAGGPYAMSISSRSEIINLDNILIGDVWVCSGQSNMEFMVGEANDAILELKQATDTQIRHFKIPHFGSNKPSAKLAGGEWIVNHPDSTGSFTAVGYYFAKEIRREVGVPIGLINASWGGSRIESWFNPKLFEDDCRNGETSKAIGIAQSRFANNLQNVKNNFPEVTSQDMGMKGNQPLWAASELDESDWVTILVPSEWENAGFEGLDGIGWYRHAFDITREESNQNIEIGLGKIDDCDRSFINGIEIGGYCDWETPRVYQVKASMLKEGRNIVTVRVEDGFGSGGIAGEPSMLYVKTKEQIIPLADKWKFRAGAHINMAFAGMYNKMIHPLTEYPIKGVLWYQGESNTNTVNEAKEYEHLFTELINNWRHQWGQGEFPFLFVQLANFSDTGVQPDNWALLRESQSKALDLVNVGQAVIIDIGEAEDIHPKNKQDVGIRLALAARKISYNQDIVFSGPIYKSHTVNGNKIIIAFHHVGSGLVSGNCKENLLKEFEIAGDDGVYFWANAKIDGSNLIVWNDEVKDPKMLRYAWANNPKEPNFYNKEGLPASPFRIDR